MTVTTPYEARAALLQLTDAELASLTAPERSLVAQAYEVQATLATGLEYMCAVNPTFQRFPHIVLIDDYLAALEQGRLYFDGPGPEPVPVTRENVDRADVSLQEYITDYDDDGVAYTQDGAHRFRLLMHPERGDRPVYNLAIDMPPRHGKSFYVSHHHPAYFLTKYPRYSVILASYEAEFAAEWGGKARDTLISFPEGGVEIVNGMQASRSRWSVKGWQGQMKTAGAGGPITGSGGHWIVLDDLVKNAEEALSETRRQSNIDWFFSTVYTRREPWDDGTPGRVVVMATRWHEEDLTGKLVPERPKQGDEWCQLHLQAIYEPNDEWPDDLLHRQPGEALCPARVPLRELHATRRLIGAQWFEALYQGSPFLAEGNLIHRPFHYATITDGMYRLTTATGKEFLVREEDCFRFFSVDLAGSKKKSADSTVIMVLDVTPTEPRMMIVRDVHELKIETAAHEAVVLQDARKWQPRFIGIEDKTFGTNLVQRFIARGGWSIRPFAADVSKELRAMPIDNSIRNELLFFLADAPWLKGLESELLKFPHVTHDDKTDALAHANNYFIRMPRRRGEKARPATTPEEIAAEHIQSMKKAKKRQAKWIPGLGRW